MTHDAAAIAGINRRIAEYEGWTEHCPDYWNSTADIIATVECLCRERRCEFTATFEDDDRWCVMFKDNSATLRLDKSLSAAACLAVVAVLDGDGNANERTEH